MRTPHWVQGYGHYNLERTTCFGQKRIQESGLSDKVDLKYCDYRDVNRQYDRVVSIEMFEAVGEKYWPVFFDKLRTCLNPAACRTTNNYN